MRIKMQCPDCGKWFTLQLSVKEAGEPHGPSVTDSSDGGDRQAADRTRSVHAAKAGGDMRAERRSVLLYRIAPIVAVVALVLIWFFAIGPAIERSRSTALEETDAAVASTPTASLVGQPATEASQAGQPAAEASEVEQPAAEASEAEQPTAEASEAEQPTAEASQAEQPATETSAPANEVFESATASRSVPGDQASREAAVADESRLELTLVASERCWVRVSSDGQVVSDLTMRAGERRSWKARTGFRLDVGSGKDIRIILNGEDLGPAGSGPRVVEGLVVTSEGLSRA